jgi:hypothetical protein
MTVEGQERPQIVLSDPNNTADSVHDEIGSLDPSAHRPGRDVNTFGHLGDREEPDLIAGVRASTGNLRSNHDAGSDSERRCRPATPGWCLFGCSSDLFTSIAGSVLIQARRSSASTSVRRPRFTARNSPDLIAS